MDPFAQRLFAESEVRAERIGAILRIVVSTLLWGSLLLVVIGPARREGALVHEQVIVAEATVTAYLLLGIVAFWLARPRLYKPWMSWVLATLDVVFILVSLELGIRNTDVSANYAVGLPVVWLTPLVLAFGAMRYDPRLVGYVALLLVGGIGYVSVFGAPPPGGDQPAPPAGLLPLFQWPPNVMRMVMLLLAGVVLTIAVTRSRALLLRAIDETRRRDNLTRYLPPQVAGMVADTDAGDIRRGWRQPAAVMFVDMRGFTRRAESMDPSDLGRFTGAFRQRVAAAVDAHGGVIDKFIGDAVMVVFGLPSPASDDAARAVACGKAILASLAEWSAARAAEGADPVSVGVGIHWGEVFCGAVGDDSRLEFAVLGDTVNVAARLEAETKRAGLPLIVSRALLEAADAAEADWTPLPPTQLRGRTQPMEIFGKTLES